MRQQSQRLQGTILFLSIVLVLSLLAVGYTATQASASSASSSAATYRHGTEEPGETRTGVAEATETEGPEATETEHVEATETEHPEAEGTEGPEATETEHPEAEGTEGPEAHETEHPEATETEHPEEHETEGPEATETEHPEAEGTEGPEATGTAVRESETTETERPERHETATVLPTTTAGATRSGADKAVVPASVPGAGTRTFKETGYSVNGLFLQHWDRNGGVAQQGFPISPVMMERSDLDGKTYAVQYFERSVMEYHPENKPPFDVLLSQLGTFQYKQKYPNGAAQQGENRATGRFFPETGHYVGGAFLQYWQEHGGLAQQGYPISGEFTEVSPLNGKVYTVQYFERAVFEYHPENKPPYNVLLSQLGTFRYKQQYGK